LQPDGSFGIDEIESGAYVLHLRIKRFAELVRDVIVPEPAALPGGARVDLGALTLEH
jgi:hypothetical protein